MPQVRVQMPVAIVVRTKAARVLPSAICKATLVSLGGWLGPRGAISHFFINDFSLITDVMNHP